MSGDSKSVLFICLGNICRSPMAEAIFRHMVKERGLEDKWLIDSAGMGDWHVGNPPDKRAVKYLKKYGVTTQHRARQISKGDFSKFSIIFGMDHNNISDINDIKPKDSQAVVKLLGEYDPEKELVIQDPYYGGEEGFETVYQQCTRCCKAFLDEMS